MQTWSFLLALWGIIKATIHAISLVYPSFLTYKALETSQLAPAHKMLSYWCTSAFIAAISMLADELLGRWATWEFWKATMLILKVAPLIIGPEKLYDHVVRPLFSSQAEKVDELNAQAVQMLTEAQMTMKEHGGQLREHLRERLNENLAVATENLTAAREALIDGALATGEKLMEKGEKMAETMAQMDVRKAGKKLVKQSVHTGKALVNTGVELLREHTLPSPFSKQHAQSQLPWVISGSSNASPTSSSPPVLTRPYTAMPSLAGNDTPYEPSSNSDSKSHIRQRNNTNNAT